ncbi:Cell cycle serine/threonine-protein kinase cdc5/MSD2 [Kluyveromyces marxianus]|uniref:Serine/threonine-protein kinase n=2 Tax=Kluyveromyces marxianus TaxID=4911 RepID=W0T2T7_KLUMD|nr:cell cycle serine/threonine-protein kinase CDC5/MSD2 [Kluyveromyces marxianus DMKU3-1042]KAG0676208.1 Cell cycle serine/threonine-protein kinase cdc5/MSD2 [Kluyveromyces marxianus]KAG0685530.1 Cell cycle serine/threonine-protein kinase cdc5/MSD2 [Kluyveromyces marxianus]QGN13946.1 cell cycle serine/threonine-protein kinase CDC5/MSD2 [Kluyveromyces marxianus]BAO37892.1 cell cycle serine/threonine-protein kinase CDC5/MSD2 [Kluyveromyces marxianus DMKU3-1042]BAP69452.1 cell cycle serine/threon
MSAPPLQIINDKQLNARSHNIHTPIKAKRAVAELHLADRAAAVSVKPSHHHNDANNRQPPQKKKKEKLSSLCKTPPSLIKTRGRDYHRGHFLGEGGFARCFQMKDDKGKIFAAKTVAKLSIKSEKTRRKLLSEIQIHKSMKHPNIVQFTDCFEDDTNVYILLEICPNGSVMELLRQRKHLTEPEVRFCMIQIIGAIRYMHSRRVIHRDLKLGNIFFDKDNNLKIGDFGLAAVLANDKERKYTICGTPNYIAPEVLTGKHTGHSYEVDIWSIGVMLYALLFGKPPFQAKEVETIYERIKCRDFSFPADKPVSSDAKNLISHILQLNPAARPSLYEITDSVWFRNTFPPKLPANISKETPNFDHLSFNESLVNLKHCMLNSGLLKSTQPHSSDGNKNPIEFVRTELEEERNRAVLPQSLSPGGTKNKYKEVIDLDGHRKFNEMAHQNRLKRAGENLFFKPELVATSTNMIKSEMSLKILASECHMTLRGIKSAEIDKRQSNYPSPDASIQDPIVVTKWVDYSNKHGFAYQLSTDDIGVLFNNGTTVLKLADAEEFWYINYDAKEGWVASHYKLESKPIELTRHLEVVDFFANYMNSNLSRISTLVRETYHKDDVFLRRYTRYKQFVMFELSDGTFQFNFKDHNKFALSHGGKLLTFISPDRKTVTLQLSRVLLDGYVNGFPSIDIFEKLELMKEGLRDKASVLSIH